MTIRSYQALDLFHWLTEQEDISGPTRPWRPGRGLGKYTLPNHRYDKRA